MFRVIGTSTYLDEISKWDNASQKAARDLPKKLRLNPFVGDPLSYRFLREKKIKGRRVYYLVYEDLKLVLLVATSGKKDQQPTINHIKSSLDEFRKVAEEILKQGP
ncbi:MAG TPA: hypothetical protein VJG90_01870 [Candidatus Nanoarchaeia archaeon]|nr:hypothetical protein [Candidatus Nanoarchaeia archaeon]